ncbi:MAG TPA: DUF4382 domain-containing protein [Myxococcota bacterium]|nr:DUF4382 domain-containing protein [Myxococcota bacterium]
MMHCRRSSLSPRLVPGLVLLLAAIGVGACSGGGSDGGGSASTASASGASGAVALLLTDAPADPSLFSEINVRLDRIDLLPEDEDDSPVTIFSGDSREIDLLDLREYSIPLAVHDAVPSGEFCRLRLAVESIELVRTDDTRVPAELPGNGRLDLVLEDCLRVREGETTVIQLDIDAGRSIHIVEAPPGSERFLFRPVVHVDLVEPTFEDKLVRVQGVLAEIDEEEREALVCDVMRVFNEREESSHRGCVEIRVDDSTSLFDNLEAEGRPRPVDELFDPEKLGSTITVVGKVDPSARPPRALFVPPGHFPPPGLCRIWTLGRPPGLQPAPSRCDLDRDDLPRSAVLIGERGRPVIDRRGLLTVDSRVVQLGEVLRLMGEVDSTVSQDELSVRLDPGQIVVSEDVLSVVLQDAPMDGGNGTQILTTRGVVLEPEDLFLDDPVTLDGVLVLDDPDFLRAALIIVDISLAQEGVASGTVVSVGGDGVVLETETNPCSRSGSDLEVRIDEETRIVTVTITEDSSTTTAGGTVEEQDSVTATGVCETDGSFSAEVVIVIDDQRDL